MLENSQVARFPALSSLEPVLSNHCLAARCLGEGVAQPFSSCRSMQNRQAVQSTGRLMDWTFEDNTVDGLFFCGTLTGRRGGHAPSVQTRTETSDTGA